MIPVQRMKESQRDLRQLCTCSTAVLYHSLSFLGIVMLTGAKQHGFGLWCMLSRGCYPTAAAVPGDHDMRLWYCADASLRMPLAYCKWLRLLDE